MNYYSYFKNEGKITKVKKWLKNNPKPKKWKGDKYSWAYTEMPIGGFNIHLR